MTSFKCLSMHLCFDIQRTVAYKYYVSQKIFSVYVQQREKKLLYVDIRSYIKKMCKIFFFRSY